MGIVYLEDGDSVKQSDTGIVESPELVFSEEICGLRRRQFGNLKKSSRANTSFLHSIRILPSHRIDYRSKDWSIPIPLKKARPVKDFKLHLQLKRQEEPELANWM